MNPTSSTGGLVPKAPPSSPGIVTVPSSRLNPVFGKVSYVPRGAQLDVTFTIMTGAGGEGWQTGVALDASTSMRAAYGHSLMGTVPPDLRADYLARGLVREEERDGKRYPIFLPQAVEDALSRGVLGWTPNTVQDEARKFIAFLADQVDADGGTTAIYWACGDGRETEEIGDITGTQVDSLDVSGPKTVRFGNATHLLPAVRYFESRFAEASNGMYVFLTDGRLDDLEEVKAFCRELAARIESGARPPIKFVLIGLGAEIDARQLDELDNLPTGNVDLWDAKIAQDLREVTEIFAEIVDETLQLAPMATVYDDSGLVVKRFADGLPPRATFSMAAGSAYFELEIPGQDRIRQPLR